MTKIILNDNYYVECDTRNYALFRKCIGPEDAMSKKGYTLLGYYQRLPQLYNDLIEWEVKISNIKTLEALLSYMEKLEKTLVSNSQLPKLAK